LTATRKLAELRSKTDRDLARYVGIQLERSRNFASAQWWSGAETAYAEALRLLPVICGLDEAERQRFDEMLQELRKTLGGACLPASA